MTAASNEPYKLNFNWYDRPKNEQSTKFLYKYVFDEDTTNTIEIFKNLKDIDIELTSKNEHPILHEICSQVYRTIELIKKLWKLKNLKKYWDNSNYKDKYGLTALQRLSIEMHNLSEDNIRWINDNMNIKPVIFAYNRFGEYDINKIKSNYKFSVTNEKTSKNKTSKNKTLDNGKQFDDTTIVIKIDL